jgi:hypothetical protein
MLSKIPTEQHPKTEKVAKLDEEGNPIESDNITVWDTEIEGWRSFNYSRIKSVN